MKQILHIMVFVVSSFGLSTDLWGQRPCADTLVRVYDSVCEGETYHFNGRDLIRSGYYYDTLPRAVGDCDSVIILLLSVLEPPFSLPGSKVFCEPPAGHRIIVYDDGSGMYYRWSSTPFDSSLIGQEHLSDIYVSPKEPTTYDVYIDYREVPQCPNTGSIQLNPVEPVVAQMYVSPDHLSYDHLELSVEDYSIGTRGTHYGGWAGRKWFLNGVLQNDPWPRTTFAINPSLEGDSVEVRMVAFSPTCSDEVVKVVPFRRVALYFPNAFTPGVEPNALFQPQVQGILEYELWVYDRRGTLVFHSQEQTPWDGTHKGVPCPMGVYVYKCRYRDLETPAGFQDLAGTVTLLR